ncbi:glycoside hydrolase family 31 protein [Algibacillus agarilyticus]|uniref:glycoside hydrolase family 31 protein n=1 Tax=Algibacillus agarilyticus TaxID=2234133 RepID=UPI000DD0D3DE|nr:TIM-barrel domain-containing protein [Algibacillus agarilyticus]
MVGLSRVFVRFSVVIFYIVAFGLSAQEHYIAHKIKDNTLTIFFESGQVDITGLTADSIGVFYQLEGQKQLPSYSLVEQRSQPNINVKARSKTIDFLTEKMRVNIEKSPLTLHFYREGKLLLSEELGFFSQTALTGFRFSLQPQEKLLGAGERVLGMDRRGHRLPLYNQAHYGYTTESKQMNFGLPAVMSTNQYVLMFDNTAKATLDLGHNEADILQFEAIGGRTAYVVTSGDSYPNLIENYTQVTGRQPLPPRWALGHFASRFGYHSEEEARQVVAKYQALGFPLDAIIFDLYWFGAEMKGNMGNLNWDRKHFPTAENMISDFKRQGVNTILISEPFITTSSSNWQHAVAADALAKNLAEEPKVFNFFFGETGLVDIFSNSGQEWFWAQYQPLLDQGIAGWWGDLGEPEVHPNDTLHAIGTADEVHNVYGHRWAQLLYEEQQKLQPEQRPFMLMRSGFNGSQRYGMMPWTGDVSRSWGGLKPQPELTMSMGLLGLAYTHSDLGGFAGGDKFDKEMYIRWLQYGVFQPIYRPHAQENIAPEPIFHDSQTQAIIRDFIKLRYRLLPYNYTLAYQNTLTGMPLMRPLFFSDENNPSLIAIKDSFMWGDAFLVSPVTEPGIESQAMYLPKGIWFDFWDDTEYVGGGVKNIPTTLQTLPVLVKAGSFIPMVNDLANTKAYNNSQLTMHYYADESVLNANYALYDDDGKNAKALAEARYEVMGFTAVQNANHLILNIQHNGGRYIGQHKQRDISFDVHNIKSVKSIFIGEQEIELFYQKDAFDRRRLAAFYNAEIQRLLIKFKWSLQDQSIKIKG